MYLRIMAFKDVEGCHRDWFEVLCTSRFDGGTVAKPQRTADDVASVRSEVYTQGVPNAMRKRRQLEPDVGVTWIRLAVIVVL